MATANRSYSRNGGDIAIAELSLAARNEPQSKLKQALATPQDATKSSPLFSRARIGIVLSLCMLSVAAQVPVFLLGGTLTFLAEDLQLGQQAGWLPTTNAIATAAISLFVGSLLDQTDKVRMMLIGTAVLCVGCIVLGTAHTLGQSLAAMAVMGIASGVIELATVSTLAEIVSPRQRGIALAILVAFTIPFCPYVLYGLLYALHGPCPTWRWTAWIALIYNGIAFLAVLITRGQVKSTVVVHVDHVGIFERVDFIGAFTSIIGSALTLVALHSAATPSHSWADVTVLAPLIIGLALITLFIIWEWRGAKYPVIPFRLFSGQRIVALATVISFIGGINFYILQYIWPMVLLNVWTVGPQTTGLYGFIVILALTIGTVLSNALLSVRKNTARAILVGASLAQTAFSGGLLTIAPDNIAQSTVLAALTAAAFGALTVPPTTIASWACPETLLSTCVALTATARAFGGSIGLSIAYVIFNNRLTMKLPQAIISSAISAGLSPAEASDFVDVYIAAHGTAVPALAQYSTAVLDAAAKGTQRGFAESLNSVWYISMVSGACAVILSLLLPSTTQYETDRVANQHNRES